MLRLTKDRETLNVVADQIGAPTGADLIADVTALAIRQVMQFPELAGPPVAKCPGMDMPGM
jgi:dTDP-4-dehydrorhamnose reductase